MKTKTKAECANCGDLIAEPTQDPDVWFSICPKCEDRLNRQAEMHDTWEHDSYFESEIEYED